MARMRPGPCGPAQDREARELEKSLRALSKARLVAFVREVALGLPPRAYRTLLDRLRMAVVRAGGKLPGARDPRLLDEVRDWCRRALEEGYAAPDQLDQLLARAGRAFLAGDRARAAAAFGALFELLAEANLGQEAMVGEVLATDLAEAAARYLAACYESAPIARRAEALWAALETLRESVRIEEPLVAMEDALQGEPSHLREFLPRWVRWLRGRVESGRDRLASTDQPLAALREAVGRLQGVDGLGRIARERGDERSYSAWARALVEAGRWDDAVAALEEAAASRGLRQWAARFHDDAARVAFHAGKAAETARILHAAWRARPTVARLLRWLGAVSSDPVVRAEKTRQELDALRRKVFRAPCAAAATLRLLAGDYRGAASALARADGLGWSSEEHPGHVIFPALLFVVTQNEASTPCSGAAVKVIEAGWVGSSLSETLDEELSLFHRVLPPLPRLSLRSCLESAMARWPPSPADRSRVLAALRQAAARRVEAVVAKKRRGAYHHAGLLVAACAAAGEAGAPATGSPWLTALAAGFPRRGTLRAPPPAQRSRR
jgi:tetratricopeptide (TPR) repeat protein